MTLHLTAEEFANLLTHEFPERKVKVLGGHVFMWADGKWNKMPFGYEGYNTDVKKWPE